MNVRVSFFSSVNMKNSSTKIYIYSILKLQNLTKLPQEIAVTTALILIVWSVFIKVSSVPDIMQGPGETRYMEQPFLLRGSWSSMCKQICVFKMLLVTQQTHIWYLGLLPSTMKALVLGFKTTV